MDQSSVDTIPSDYWGRLREIAARDGFDGCSGVPDFHLDCCYEHDLHWRTGKRLDGTPITKAEADVVFRRCIQDRSPLGKFSPMSWWRWAGLVLRRKVTGLK